MGSVSALECSSPASHCGTHEQSLPKSEGRRLAFWKWLWLLTLAVLRVEGSPA